MKNLQLLDSHKKIDFKAAHPIQLDAIGITQTQTYGDIIMNNRTAFLGACLLATTALAAVAGRDDVLKSFDQTGPAGKAFTLKFQDAARGLMQDSAAKLTVANNDEGTTEIYAVASGAAASPFKAGDKVCFEYGSTGMIADTGKNRWSLVSESFAKAEITEANTPAKALIKAYWAPKGNEAWEFAYVAKPDGTRNPLVANSKTGQLSFKTGAPAPAPTPR
ncbi:MAG TPA: hypothetical protein DIS76_04130 [Rhodospirillaceae bacterium]|nr:hypothetical protein [Rhodospirillaceae bacterium]